MIYPDPFFPTIFERVIATMNASIKRIGCDYEHAESSYGTGDSEPCGRDVVPGGTRCQKHVNKD